MVTLLRHHRPDCDEERGMNEWKGRFGTVDPEIQPLVIALNEAGVESDWSCSGEPGHMAIRPTIQARTHAFAIWEIILVQENLRRVRARRKQP